MKLYQKPTCSKCLNLMKTLNERKVVFDAINYYNEPLSSKELKDILSKLDMAPRDIMRKTEPIYKKLGLNQDKFSDNELIEIMIANPDLIQRPIVINGNTAKIVRSEESMNELLKDI